MSREIKFRAWDKVDKRMAEVLLIDWLNKLVDLNQGVIERDFGQIELLQYSGLKEEHGNEMYEGDIIEIHDLNLKRHVVRYVEGQFVFASNWHSEIFSFNEMANFLNDDIEVIKLGNIYENPELLERLND